MDDGSDGRDHDDLRHLLVGVVISIMGSQLTARWKAIAQGPGVASGSTRHAGTQARSDVLAPPLFYTIPITTTTRRRGRQRRGRSKGRCRVATRPTTPLHQSQDGKESEEEEGGTSLGLFSDLIEWTDSHCNSTRDCYTEAASSGYIR